MIEKNKKTYLLWIKAVKGFIAYLLGVRYSRYSVLIRKRDKFIYLKDNCLDWNFRKKFKKAIDKYLWYWVKYNASKRYWILPALTKDEWQVLIKEKTQNAVAYMRKVLVFQAKRIFAFFRGLFEKGLRKVKRFKDL